MTGGGPGPIRFGTSGWRGIVAEDFTFPRARIAVRAIARWIAQRAGRGREVIVAHDRRVLGDRFARTAAAILPERGLVPVVADGPVPTPVAAHAVLARGAAGALVFTASHNPPEYQGLKVLGEWGGSLEPAHAREIEAMADALEDGDAPAGAPPAAPDVDLVEPYGRDLLARLDRDALRRSPPTVLYDAMHGVGSGVLDRLLAESGVPVRVLRGGPDPTFGGMPPDPTPEHLRALVREVGGSPSLDLGLATDGDADRFAVVDGDGALLSETQILALLVDSLARTSRISQGVAISIATGSLVERVAADHGLAVSRHPIGFRHLSSALSRGTADAAGEESGGFAWGPFGRDKDGILAGCLVAEMRARAGRPLRERLAELEARHGGSACGRTAIPAGPRERESLAKLASDPPARVDGCAVRDVTTVDGVHLVLDDGFAMLRASGTEPVLRIYAEARDSRALERRLRAASRLLLRGA